MSQRVVTLNLEGHCLVRLMGIMFDNPSANVENLTRMALAVSQFVASKASNYLVPLVLGHLHFDPGVAIAAMLGIAKQKCGKCAHCKIKIFKHSFFIM